MDRQVRPRLVAGGLAWLLALSGVLASCSDEERRRRRGDNDAGEAGAEASGGAGAASSGGTTSGRTGSGADGSGATGATNSGATGSGATGATGSGATGATGSGATAGASSSGGGGEAGEDAGNGGTSSAGTGECSGEECNATCGDGRREGAEECDDGGTAEGDGCSSTCAVEADFTCTGPVCTPGGACVLRLPATFRDFNASASAFGHPDFEVLGESLGATQGLVESVLDEEGKPVASPEATSVNGNIQSQASFAQWYREPAIPGEIVLWDDGAGGFVNRWGANGEQWVGYPNVAGYTYCTGSCSSCGEPPAGHVCLERCAPLGLVSFACIIEAVHYDGNPLFFPLDSSTGVLTDTRGEGKIPETYGYVGWPWEGDVATALGITAPIPTATAPFPSTTHNFSFTTEVRFWFRYDGVTTQRLSFLGDDDVWVFVNGHLAVDLGGWHVPLDATLTFEEGSVSSSTTTSLSSASPTVVQRVDPASVYGLEPGEVYEVAVFHAERQKEGSSFKLGLSGFDAGHSVCAKN